MISVVAGVPVCTTDGGEWDVKKLLHQYLLNNVILFYRVGSISASLSKAREDERGLISPDSGW